VKYLRLTFGLHRTLQDPIQLVMDIVRLEFCSLATSALLIVLYVKVKALSPETVFNLGCTADCPSQYAWFRIGPLVVRLGTSSPNWIRKLTFLVD
jgi:hypothetical protein